MINEQQAKKMAKKQLSSKRYVHTLNVKRIAVRLAEKNGESTDKAALAALLHDIAKEIPRDELLQILNQNDIIASDYKNRAFASWHGMAAAVLAKDKYDVDDEDILNAIKYHTTGRAGMSRLEKIIYMADMTSEERTYPEAQLLRKAVFDNLDKGTLEGLRQSILWLEQSNKPIDPQTKDAFNFLRQITEDYSIEQQ